MKIFSNITVPLQYLPLLVKSSKMERMSLNRLFRNSTQMLNSSFLRVKRKRLKLMPFWTLSRAARPKKPLCTRKLFAQLSPSTTRMEAMLLIRMSLLLWWKVLVKKSMTIKWLRLDSTNALKDLDINKDGVIDLSEFSRWFFTGMQSYGGVSRTLLKLKKGTGAGGILTSFKD